MLTEKERKILYSIRVASENDPHKPEFPPDNPKFPATPTYKINVPGFSNVWLKDESENPTGTHKDRMAWEMVVTYRDILLAKKKGFINEKLPHLSIITSGAAGVAIQTLLKKYSLPPLKCLLDNRTPKEIVNELEHLGAELYFTDLSRQYLSWKKILSMTNNETSIDVTSSDGLDPTFRFYDWLSYETINQNPDYCFVPFGTGRLFRNILNVNKREVNSRNHDPRFRGDVKTLRKCNFIGATVNDSCSKAQKLFLSYKPFTIFDEQWLRCYRICGFCGEKSNVYAVREEFIEEAFKIVEEQGIECEHSGIAGLGLLLQMKKEIPTKAKILIVNTGKVKLTH